MEPYREPLSALVLPLLVTLPIMAFIVISLSICAGITTALACGVLLYRVVVAYVEAACTLSLEYFGRIPGATWLRGRLLRMHEYPAYSSSSEAQSPALSPSPARRHSRQQSGTLATGRTGQPTAFSRSNGHHHPHHSLAISPPGSHVPTPALTPHYSPVYQYRRLSTASINSVPGFISPVGGGGPTNDDDTSMYDVGLPPSLGIERDFEGLGGWRLSGVGTEDDDAVWDALHSRLELPAYRHPHNTTTTTTSTTTTTTSNGNHTRNKSLHRHTHHCHAHYHHYHHHRHPNTPRAGTGSATPTAESMDLAPSLSPQDRSAPAMPTAAPTAPVSNSSGTGATTPRVANVSKVRVPSQVTRPLPMTVLGG